MYTEYSPCRLLSSYIDKYWEFKGNPEYGMRINILPDGCTDFIFTLGEVAQIVGEHSIMQPYRSYFVGPMNKYSELVTYTDSVHMLGIRFLPCGIFRFMNLPLPEFINQRVNTDELNSLFDHTFTERLDSRPNLAARIGLIEEMLIKALRTRDRTDRQISLAIQLINCHQGKLPIQTLMEKICLCQRQFERKFKLLTGFTPKEYSRIMKFRNVIGLLTQANRNNLLSIALDTGYYDSAHLAKEIKSLSGKTTTSFLAVDLPPDITLTYI